jgi:hypothetical protein
MHPNTFDELARSLGRPAPRRRLLALLGASAAGGLAVSTLRSGLPVAGQELAPASPATPVVDDAGALDGVSAGAEGPVDAVDLQVCEQWLLAGGPVSTDPIHVDDDLTVYVNDHAIFEDADGLTNIFAPIPFGAKNGDQLTVAARDLGSCRKISALWLHCAAGGEPRFLTAGFDDGCDPERGAPENFYRESWRI